MTEDNSDSAQDLHPRISVSVGRKINDGDFGSFSFDFGVQLDVPRGVPTEEFIDEVYVTLHEKLVETLVKNNLIERPKD